MLVVGATLKRYRRNFLLDCVDGRLVSNFGVDINRTDAFDASPLMLVRVLYTYSNCRRACAVMPKLYSTSSIQVRFWIATPFKAKGISPSKTVWSQMSIRSTEWYDSFNAFEIWCLKSGRSDSTFRLFPHVTTKPCWYALDNRYHVPSRYLGK